MWHTVALVLFFAMVVAPCVAASRVDLDAEEELSGDQVDPILNLAESRSADRA